MRFDYSTVTEQPGDLISLEALSMLYSRYRFASQHAAGKRLLEVACGPGLGVHYLAKHAGFVVGGDYTLGLVQSARRSVPTRLPLLALDAQFLPLAQGSMDIVICFEALYYFPEPERFLAECRRVLRPDGLLLLCTVNPEWPDFYPSKRSYRYYSAASLERLFMAQGFAADLFGAFPVRKERLRDHGISLLRRAAIALHLIPSTMKGKQVLKRLFLGKLAPIPRILSDGIAPYRPPVRIETTGPVRDFKLLFATGRPS